MAIINGCDESKVWLHVERLDDKVCIVDQDGRVVGGCINLLLDVTWKISQEQQSLLNVHLVIKMAKLN